MQTAWNTIYRFFYPERNPIEVKAEYGIPDKIHFKTELENGNFVVTSPELPGLITQARSHEELLDNVNDAVLTYFDVPKSESDCVFDEIKFDTPIAGVVTVRKKERMQLA